MRCYDPSEPLIFIHVPKTAGAAVRQVFMRWFPGLVLHYFNERMGTMPARRQLAPGAVVYGHFNRLRGFGVPDYYPQVRQFITILRDPFEMALSGYFYTRKVAGGWKGKPALGAIEAIVKAPLNMLNHFPVEVTEANYREVIDRFLFVGITEQLEESMKRIAAILGKPYIEPERINSTERTGDFSHLRAEFENNHRLERQVYHYCVAKMAAISAPLSRGAQN